MKKILILVALCCHILPAISQKVNFNKDWQFQRLDKTIDSYEIVNQGTSWESQFNITHTASDSELKVSEDTLKSEFKELHAAKWEAISLPHTPKIEDLVVLHQWQGICYYKKEINYDSQWDNRKIWLEFEGAMHLSDIWVNGKHIMQHAGGYTPFVLDLTTLLQKDKPNEILVRLDNRDNPLIPPGKPVGALDFCYYGGIYRNVNLMLKPKDVFISHPIMADEVGGGGIFVTYPKVSDTHAHANIKTHVVNESASNKDLIVSQRLFELNGLYGKYRKGKEVANNRTNIQLESGRDIHQNQLLNIDEPRLWSPDSPNLYLLQSEIYEDGKIIESHETRIGIRHIEFTKEKGFYLNGKPLRLVGSNRHMEYPYVGNALPDNAQYRDIYHIKESGFNVVRLGHYPQTVSTLDACDELGLLAIEPIPGWQFFNKTQLFSDLTYRDVKDMIRRDRNHPSVIMWETTLNEAWPPNSWKDEAVRIAHAEYPGDQFYSSGDGYGYDGFDVVYNDWKEGFLRPTPSSKAGFIREYYDYEFGGHYSTTRIGRADGEKALIQNAWNAQWSHNRYRKQYPSTSGDAVWSMYDYNRGCCDNICESGVADIFRLPKFSLHFYKSQTSNGTPLPTGKMKPYLFIANYWTERKAESDTIVVYGNVDEVELKVNGKTIARQHKDNGSDTEYVKGTDGGNSKNLTQAPFTFNGVKWEKGALEAIGYIKGKKTVSEKRMTPKTAQKLDISYFESGTKASKNDLLLVYVQVLDENGTLCVDNNDLVNLTVNEGHQIQGPAATKALAGVATFLISTGDVSVLDMHAQSQIGNSKKQYKLSN